MGSKPFYTGSEAIPKNSRQRHSAGTARRDIEPWRLESRLEGLAGRSHKISQGRNVRAVSADPPGVHRKSQAFRQIQIQSCIIQFRKAESCRG
jgi:hypothetical protein